MDPLLAALAVVGLFVGATGTWSPCGLSMIETIGPTGHEGGLSTTLAASATFTPFAVLGGAITYGVLAWLGGVVAGEAGTAAYVVAAAVAIAAAAAEARGVPIMPQVRRQLPVRWRSSMPMPVAAAGYGVLLGLGFTTFVLSYGVWALMGIVLAVGDPIAGLIAGVAFGVGRALPIVVLAPLADRRSGERACEAMTMNTGWLRGARLGDAAALLALAAVLIGTAAGAEAAKKVVKDGSDPATAGPALVFETGKGGARLLKGDGDRMRLPGHDPATGGSWIATVTKDSITVLDRKTLEPVSTTPAAGADGLAVSNAWLAIRTHRKNRDRLLVGSLGEKGAVGGLRSVASAKRPAQLSRPALDGNKLIVAVAKSRRNSLVRLDLREGKAPRRKTILAARDFGLTAPAIDGGKVAYVRTAPRHQEVMLMGAGGGKSRRVYRRNGGRPILWNTAIAGSRVYVTLLDGAGRGRIVSVGR
jgi:hypothetical protein